MRLDAAIRAGYNSFITVGDTMRFETQHNNPRQYRLWWCSDTQRTVGSLLPGSR